MVVPSRPVNDYICSSSDYQIGSINAASCSQFAEIIESLKSWAVKALVDFENLAHFFVFPNYCLFLLFKGTSNHLELLDNSLSFRCDPSFQILDVKWVMKVGDLRRCGLFRLIDLEEWSEEVIVNEAVYHFHALGFHWMLFTELVFSDIFVIEIADLSHPIISTKLEYLTR